MHFCSQKKIVLTRASPLKKSSPCHDNWFNWGDMLDVWLAGGHPDWYLYGPMNDFTRTWSL